MENNETRYREKKPRVVIFRLDYRLPEQERVLRVGQAIKRVIEKLAPGTEILVRGLSEKDEAKKLLQTEFWASSPERFDEDDGEDESFENNDSLMDNPFDFAEGDIPTYFLYRKDKCTEETGPNCYELKEGVQPNEAILAILKIYDKNP